MQRQRRSDTRPEVLIRRHLHAAGLRYRIDVAPLPGMRRRADIVFHPARLAVFVDGCFWHVCPLHATWPARNAGWWRDKLLANEARDRDTDAALAAAGWRVVRIGEHEDPAGAAERIRSEVQR